MNRNPYNIKSIIKKNGEEIYELGYQYTNLFFEFNTETFGLNRKEHESLSDYFKRIRNHDLIFRAKDNAIIDLAPHHMKYNNSKFKVYDHTYYFSLACNLRKKKVVRQREVFKTPKNVSN